MPRVMTKTAGESKKTRMCCHKPECFLGGEIQPGQRYHSWSFMFGGEYYMHEECGYPKRSQLTQSKMGPIYDMVDAANAIANNWDGTDLEVLRSEITTLAEAVEEVRKEYEDADEALGGHGTSANALRAEELEGWISYLQDWDPEDFELDLMEEGESEEEYRDQWREDILREYSELVEGCPL